MSGIAKLSTKMPTAPKNADFAIYIEFEPGTKNPERVFQAAAQTIQSLQALDCILCKAVDSNIEPIMLLEEIETGSIKIWIRNQLERIDDNDLRKLDWKPIVGEYLVNAKYAVIDWTNKDPDDLSKVNKLQNTIKKLAEKTGIKTLPIYGDIDAKDITNIAKNINKAKKMLSESDKMKYITKDKEVDFDLGFQVDTENIEQLMTKETLSGNNEMILVVKKPDYLGMSKWDFKHASKTISASIEDSTWLNDFQNRNVDIRPGDALRCNVRIEIKYGYDNEVVTENYFVVEVSEILNNQNKAQKEIKIETNDSSLPPLSYIIP